MNTWLAVIAAALVAIFFLLGAFHVAWAFGVRNEAGVVPEVGGKPAFRPGPFGTLAVAAALFGCAALIAAVAGWISLPIPVAWLPWLSYALAAAFFGRAIGEFRLVGFFKKVRGTSFARNDTLYYSPLCLGIAIAVLVLARIRFAAQ